MEPNNNIPVGGFNIHNLNDNNVFFTTQNKKIKLSFKIDNIHLVNDSEIMNIISTFTNQKLIIRLMKFHDEESDQPSLVIDTVDPVSQEIKFKADKIFYSGVGLGSFLASHGLITQWEIIPIDKICRSFVLGDSTSFINLIDEFNIKLSEGAHFYIKNELE